MPKYRIRIYNTKGLDLMLRNFEDKAEFDSYWVKLQDQKNLLGFSGQGMIVLSKEILTPNSNWEVEDMVPVMIQETM